jgi:acyl-CoA reductase-like NAD-dependent aldehyde dehydrogenase
MPIVTEKTFGPVILLVIFDPVDEVVSMVQRNEYGLVLTLVTDDLGRAEAFDGEDVDIVWIDAWDGHAAGTPHDRVEQNGSGAGGWRGESFLDLGTPPQFVKFPGPAIEGIAQ